MRTMNKPALSALLLGFLFFLGTGTAANAQNSGDAEKFASNVEFCAYMVSPPGSESREFLSRYESGLSAALAAQRRNAATASDTQLIFELRSRCAATLADPAAMHSFEKS